MEQITASVRHSAEAATQASAPAASAATAARKGGAEVGHVVTTLGEIQASSRKIANIIGTLRAGGPTDRRHRRLEAGSCHSLIWCRRPAALDHRRRRNLGRAGRVI